MYLVKPSDKSQSEPVDFYFYMNSDKNMQSLPPFDILKKKSVGYRNIVQYSLPENQEKIRKSRPKYYKTEESKLEIKNNLGSHGGEPEEGISFTQKILNMNFDEVQKAYF